ncbi:uncharacterized protein V6R79_022315 [Siganus canaliculatus]
MTDTSSWWILMPDSDSMMHSQSLQPDEYREGEGADMEGAELSSSSAASPLGCCVQFSSAWRQAKATWKESGKLGVTVVTGTKCASRHMSLDVFISLLLGWQVDFTANKL